MPKPLSLSVGVKADPIEYRYSYDWLLRVMAEEGLRHLQIGTFFEIYHLPDAWFTELRRKAEDHGVTISSVFTAHRELGGFFRLETGWEEVAHRNYARLIEAGALMGAVNVGSNPGAILRDHMGEKAEAMACYIRNMKDLMRHAHSLGVKCLTIEPMSCLAEPPTLPEEIRAMAGELETHHMANPGATSKIGICGDISHGYADRDKVVRWTNTDLLLPTLPWLEEIHLKNTDALFNSTFGFTEAERKRGVVDIPALARTLRKHADELPVDHMVGYFEVGGPKLGRDYSDCQLEASLRESIQYLKEAFISPESMAGAAHAGVEAPVPIRARSAETVQIAPSIMCADQCHLEDSVRQLEAIGADYLHIDIMDAGFTPNMPLGLEVLKQLRPKTSLPYDIHLMVNDNSLFIDLIAPLKPRLISVHVESCVHLDRVLTKIRATGALAGAALNPHTPLDMLKYVLDRLDFVMLMTVNPGYAGQSLVPSGIQKIADCRAFLKAHGRDIPIEVDGNVSFEHIPAMVGAGADILVAGSSSVYHKDASLGVNMARTREVAREGLAMRK